GCDPIAAVERTRKRFELLDRRGQIRVHQQDALAARRGDAGPERRTLAAVLRQRDQPNGSVAMRTDVALHDGGRFVSRAVVGDDDVPRLTPAIQEPDRALEGALDARRLVVRRDHDRKTRRRRCGRRIRHLQGASGHYSGPPKRDVVYATTLATTTQ